MRSSVPVISDGERGKHSFAVNGSLSDDEAQLFQRIGLIDSGAYFDADRPNGQVAGKRFSWACSTAMMNIAIVCL